MTDLRSITFRCDFCGCVKELREFHEVADGGFEHASKCNECFSFQELQDLIELARREKIEDSQIMLF